MNQIKKQMKNKIGRSVIHLITDDRLPVISVAERQCCSITETRNQKQRRRII